METRKNESKLNDGERFHGEDTSTHNTHNYTVLQSIRVQYVQLNLLLGATFYCRNLLKLDTFVCNSERNENFKK